MEYIYKACALLVGAGIVLIAIATCRVWRRSNNQRKFRSRLGL